MVNRSTSIFAVALGTSLAIHAAVWVPARNLPVHPANIALRGNGGSGIGSTDLTVRLADDGTPKNEIDPASLPDLPPPIPEEAPPPPDVTPPEPEKLPPPPKRDDVEKFPEKLGRQDGEGIATHEAKGDKPMQARPADQDQPYLSRDPRGVGRPEEPSMSVAPPGDGGTGGSPGSRTPPTPRSPEQEPADSLSLRPPQPKPLERVEVGEYRPGPIEVRIPSAADGVDTGADKIDERIADRGPLAPARPGAEVPEMPDPKGAIRPVHPDGLMPRPPSARIATSPPPAPLPLRLPPAAEAPAAQVTPTVPQPVVAAAAVATGDGGRPGSPRPAADAAQESESEVDPFSKIGSWTVLREGSAQPQFGREVKTRKPRIPIPGMIDAALGARSVTMRVHIGVDGRVTKVAITRSSGSNEIDQPCLIAMYDWWFEPLKDKRGNPVPDVVQFTLNFR